MELPKKTFSRTVTEFLIIVVGVLVALAVESWRDDVEERAREHDYLQRLLVEFHADAARIASAIEAMPIQLQHIEAALTILDEDGDDGPRELLSVFMASRSIWSRQIGATFRDLLGTGQLRLVQNSGLRDRLISFYSWIGVAIVTAPGLEDRIPYRNIVRGEISPHLQESIRECGGRQARTLGLPDWNMISDCDFDATQDEIVSILANIRSNPQALPALRRWAAAFTALQTRLAELEVKVRQLESLIAEEIGSE